MPEAIALLQRAVAQREAANPRSREYADALRELGNAQAYAGQWASADSTWRRAVPVMQRLYGPRHPDVGFLLTNLGTVASMRGDLETAERDLTDAAAISAAWFGEHHWLTAGARFPLGQTLNRKGKFDQAAVLLREVIADYQQQPLVAMGPAISLAQNALGHALVGLGNRSEARVAFESAGVGLRAALGAEHMNVLLNDVSLASMLTDDGKPEEAIVVLERSIRTGIAKYGPSHPEVAAFRLKLGRAFLVARRPNDAVKAISAGLHTLDSLKAGKPDDLKRAIASLDTAYVLLGDTANATRARARLARGAAGSLPKATAAVP